MRALTNNEVLWDINYNEIAWLVNDVRANDIGKKGIFTHGESILHICAREGSEKVLMALIKTGYNLNCTDNYGHTPLFSAISSCNHGICEALIDQGADVNHKDRNLNTPLHKAASENDIDSVMILIKSGANINATNKHLETPLKVAMQNDFTDICRVLFDNGASL